MTSKLSIDADRILQFLASMPTGRTTTTVKPLRELLLATDGQMMSCGRPYNIYVQPLGVGVYKVSLFPSMK